MWWSSFRSERDLVAEVPGAEHLRETEASNLLIRLIRSLVSLVENMEISIYYEDTDCGGVVYYANYLKYFERARTQYLEERGLSVAGLMNKARRSSWYMLKWTTGRRLDMGTG